MPLAGYLNIFIATGHRQATPLYYSRFKRFIKREPGLGACGTLVVCKYKMPNYGAITA